MIRARIGWLVAYASATFLAFPHPVGDRVVDLGFALAFVAPAFLIGGVRGLPPGAAARFGFLASLLAHSAVLHWIYVVTVVYGQAPPLVGVLAPVGLAVYIAVFGAAFGAGAAWLERRGAAGPFALAALWTTLDWLRHHFLSGFPWGVIGYAQHDNPALMALAAFGGVYVLSFVTVLGSAVGIALLRAARAGRRPPREVAFATAVVTLALAAGFAQGAREGAPPTGSIRIAVVQGNIDQGVKWSEAFQEETMSIYEGLSRQAGAQGAELILWPETAVPASLETDARFRTRLEDLARELDAVLVVGAVGIEHDQRGLRYYDSAYVFDTGGQRLHRYDKSHLVPFGEYVPFRDLLGLVIGAVARGMATDNVTPGEAPRALALPLPERPGRSRALEAPPVMLAGVPICYELLFPDLVRRFVAEGAEVLLALTNDAWYGRTGAPYQFLAITALRSAETRVWTARAANTGVSAFIDDRGRVRSQTRIFERGFLVADVPLRSDAAARSFYVRHGDVFAWSCCAFVVAWGALRRRQKEAPR